MTKYSNLNLKEALRTIESIAMINNEDEKDKVLLDIYMVAHPAIGDCKNPHFDWLELRKKISDGIKDY